MIVGKSANQFYIYVHLRNVGDNINWMKLDHLTLKCCFNSEGFYAVELGACLKIQSISTIGSVSMLTYRVFIIH